MDTTSSVLGLGNSEGGGSIAGGFAIEEPCIDLAPPLVTISLAFELAGSEQLPLPTLTILFESEVVVSGFQIGFSTQPTASVSDYILLVKPFATPIM